MAERTARAVSRTVGVTGLSVDADIGINLDEIGVKQELIIDIALKTSPSWISDLEETVDYRQLVELCQSLASVRTGLIETFADKLMEACHGLPPVIGGTIRIRKPGALSNGVAETLLTW